MAVEMRKRVLTYFFIFSVVAVLVVSFFGHPKSIYDILGISRTNELKIGAGSLASDVSWFMTSDNFGSQHPLGNHGNQSISTSVNIKSDASVFIAVTLCGLDVKHLLDQLLVLLKSLVITSEGRVTEVIVIADRQSVFTSVKKKVATWPDSARAYLVLRYVPVWYPSDKQWLKSFRAPCTTERLYYPTILPNYDAVIHVDVDTVFLRPAEELWRHFAAMDAHHQMALAPEHEDAVDAYYNTPLNKIPFYGRLGLNAGVILMNLTRLRRMSDPDWTSQVHNIYREYREAPLHFADQDILNVYFHFHPDRVLELPCNWNYRNDFCRFKSNTCPSAIEQDGIALLHGNRGSFLSEDEPAFKVVYKAFAKYNWDFDVRRSLVDPMVKSLSETTNTMCGIQPNASSYTQYLRSRFG